MTLERLTLDDALQLLSLPRTVGIDPADGGEITAQNGRYGPYLKKEFVDPRPAPPRPTPARSRPRSRSSTSPSTRRWRSWPSPSGGRDQTAAAPLRELGVDPVSEKPMVIKDGRFGPYVTDGETNASLRKGDEVETITDERASELLQARRDRIADGGGKKKAAKKKAPAKKKAAAKKKAPAKKKAAAKKAPAKKAAPAGRRARSPDRRPTTTPPTTTPPLSRPVNVGGMGRFVVFEGGEGSGKSTQARLLAERWGACSRSSRAAPTVGARLRGDPARAPSTGDLDPRAEALLMAADRAHHVATKIRPGAQPGQGRGLRPVRRARRSPTRATAAASGSTRWPRCRRSPPTAWCPTWWCCSWCPPTRPAPAWPPPASPTGWRPPATSSTAGWPRATPCWPRHDPDRWVVVDGGGTVDEVEATRARRRSRPGCRSGGGQR